MRRGGRRGRKNDKIATLCVFLELLGLHTFSCLSKSAMNTCETISGHTSSVDKDCYAHWRITKVETFLGRVLEVTGRIGLVLKSFGRVRNVFGTCVGRCCHQQRVKWSRNRHGARHLCFVIYFTLICSLSRMTASFLMHSFSRLLACFLLSVTRSLSSSFRDSLGRLLVSCPLPSPLTSLIHQLARRLLSSSFLSFNIARVFLTFHSLTHSLTHSITHSPTYSLTHSLTHTSCFLTS